VARESAGAWQAVEVVQMADPKEVLRMIPAVSKGDFLLVRPRARVLVALGICGV